MSFESKRSQFEEEFSGFQEPLERCHCCGALLMEGEGYYEKDGKPYCEDCLEGATLDDLVRISEIEADTLLSSIGLRHAYIEVRW